MSAFDINQLTISGNLTRNPELRHLPNGQTVCNIRIAHNHRIRNADDTWTDQPHYFDVTIWNALGQWIASNITQGTRVVIAGRLRWREYTTTDGAHRQAIDITADSIVPMPRSTTPEPTPAGQDDEHDIAF
jgi:single-strand DNA-binding protein